MRGFSIAALFIASTFVGCASDDKSDQGEVPTDDGGGSTDQSSMTGSPPGEASAGEGNGGSSGGASTDDQSSSSDATNDLGSGTASGANPGSDDQDGETDDADDSSSKPSPVDDPASDDGLPAPTDDNSGDDDNSGNDDNSDTDDSTNVGNAAADDITDDTASDDSAGTPDETSDDDASLDDSGPSSGRLTAIPVGDSEAALGYWEYLPPNYGDEPLPLLIFTHGAAWQGEGSLDSLQELLEVGPPNLISTDAWPSERPFIVLSPQNPRSGCFDAGDIDGFYRYAVERYDVDLTRIYHTGQSCGAIGAWNYLAAHLDEFVTAAVLISGDGQDAFASAGCDLGRVAIWGLHNELDGAVSSAGTTGPIESLRSCDPAPDVELTIYEGETEHDAWTKTYDLSAGNDIYEWLLEHVHP